MQQINQSIKQVLNQDLIINPIQNKLSKTLSDTKNVTVNGISALDLIGEKASGEDFTKAKHYIQLSFGIDYDNNDIGKKFDLLFDLIAEDNWTAERLHRTVKYFLKTKKYPNWTIADWFDYDVKLYPYAWYLEQVNKGAKDNQFDKYKVNGIVLWKFKDGIELPFERVL